MEGNGSDLEEESREQRNHRHPGERIGRRTLRKPRRDLCQLRRTADAVEQRHAVEQEAGGKRPQQEELDRRLVRSPVAAQKTCQHVFAQGHQFESNEQHNEVRAGGQEHHPDGREQHQGVVFAVVRVLDFEIFCRNQHHQRRRQHDDQLQVDRERIQREPSVKAYVGRFAGEPSPEPRKLVGGEPQPDERRHRVQILFALLDQKVEQEDRQAKDGHQDFGLDGLVVGGLKEGVPHQCVTPGTCSSLSRGGRAGF